MSQDEKLAHIRKLIYAVRVHTIGISIFVVFFISSALGELSLHSVPAWFLVAYFFVMISVSWLILILNCCPWCGAAFLWKESISNQIWRLPPLSLSVSSCANCGMPNEKNVT